MASRRRLRKKAERAKCRGKRAHETLLAAQIVITRMKRRDEAAKKDPTAVVLFRPGWLTPYKCPLCGKWHVGHMR